MERAFQERLDWQSRVRGPPVIASIHAEGVFSLRYCSIVQLKTVGQTARCITLRLATNGPSVALPSLMIVGII